MGKSAPSPPPAPDYVGAAQAQGQANIQAGQQTASLGNPNITNPYGSQTVTYQPTGPNGDMQPYVNQTLNPNSQAALDSQQQVQAALGQLGVQGIGQAQNILGQPFQYQGPGIQTSLPNVGQAQTSLGNVPQAQTSLGNVPQAQSQFGNYGQVSAGPSAQTNLNLSNVAQMPVNAGMTGQNAILSRLDPQIQQNNQALQQQLANQGISGGSEAYNNAMRVQNQQNNDLYTQAALQGLGLDMSANQQGYNQALGAAGLYNQGLAQNYGQQLGAQAQNFNQGLAGGEFANQAAAQNYQQQLGAAQFGNQAIGQNFNQGLQAAQFGNQGVAQNYNQALGAGQFGNTAATQALQQQLGLYNQPLNEITALMSGSQIQNPQFQQYQGAGIQAAPIANATAQQGQYNQGIYGQQVAAYNAGMQGLGGLFGGLGSVLGAAAPGGGSLASALLL